MNTAETVVQTATRHPALDWIKCLAILAVVVTHAGEVPFPGVPGWTIWDTILRQTLPSFHVPCLLMVSGYLYYRPSAIGCMEILPRLRRILVPYLLASLVAFAVVPYAPTNLQEAGFALVTASALGIYYYVFLLTMFLLVLPIVSRLGTRTLLGAIGLLTCAAIAICVDPRLRLSTNPHVAVRNPVEGFTLAYFLIGWVSAAAPARLLPANWSRRGYGVALAAAVAWPVASIAGTPYPWIIVAKIPYAVLVWASAWRFFDRRPAPRFVRWVADASYGVFLFHFFALVFLFVTARQWPPPVRIVALATASTFSALLLGVALQRAFGPDRARRWFGY